jgi:hypothetical protein
MLGGFQPLDLSFLKGRQLDSTKLGALSGSTTPDLKTIAQTISSGTNWEQIKKNLDAAKEASPQEPTFWGGLMDFLSSGNYAVANAIDEGIDGNNADKNDSVASSILKSAEGAGKGALKGLWTGLSSGVSAMTGTNDDVARSQMDKTRFSDLIQKHTPLGIRVNPNTGEFYTNDDPTHILTESDAKKHAIGSGLIGMVGDIAFDPLTYFGGGLIPKINRAGKAASTLGESLAELPKIPEEFVNLKDVKGFGKTDIPVGLNAMPKIESTVNTATGVIPTMTKGTKFEAPVANNSDPFASLLDEMMGSGELSAAKNIGDIPKGPKVTPVPLPTPKEITAENAAGDALLTNPEIQHKLASKIGQFVAVGPDAKNVVKNVMGWLNSKHSGLEFPNVVSYMEKLRQQADPKFFALMQRNPEFRKRVLDGIHSAVKADVASSTLGKSKAAREAKEVLNAAAPVKSAKEIIEDIAKGTDDAAYAGKLASLLSKQDAGIFKGVVDDFNDVINTGIFKTARDPEALAKAVKNGINVKWSGPTQVNVWDKILHRLGQSGQAKYFTKSRYTKALQMLRAFEDHYVALGHSPMSGFKAAHSVPLRLSDVISHIGLDNFVKHSDLITTVLRSAFSGGEMHNLDKLMKTNPELASAIHNGIEKAKAGSAIAEAPKVEAGINAGKTTAETILAENVLSSAKQAEVITGAQKVAKDISLNSGASATGAKAAGNWVKDALEAKDPVGAAMQSSKLDTMQQLSGKLDAASINHKFSNASKVTTAISKQLGPVASVASKVGPAAKVGEWLGARFNAAYRNADMRPLYLQYMASAKATVSLRAAQVNSLVRKYGKDGDLWHEAMQTAQGNKIGATPEIQGLAQELQKVMEDLFGGSGLRQGAQLEHSVVGRAQILRRELNDSLKRFGLPYQFTNAGKYSDGVDWMKSWESWDVKNPLTMMYQVQNAVETTVRTRAMFDEVISRFGSYTAKPGYTATISPAMAKEFPYLKGIKFQPAMAEQANYFLKAFKEINTPNSHMIQQLENIMGKWKSSVTIYRPAHYWRNLVGDITFNWLADVKGTKPYSIATKAMQSQKGKYSWENGGQLSNLTGPDALKKAISGATASGPLGRNTAFTMKNGQKVTNDMLYISAFQQGILPSARILEDLPDKVPSLLDKVHLPGKLEGRGQALAHNVHEQRDHFTRLAHYADALMKSGKSFEQASADAAAIVRKWHPDGMDLTKFEKRLRIPFPFYSWTRKAIPLAVESVYTNPGKVMLYPKLQYGVQSSILGGASGNSMADPFPEGQLWPDWMREKGIGPLWGEPGDFSFINPSNPIQDLAAQFGNVPQMLGNGFSPQGIGGLATMVNPAAKIPAEMMTGTNFMTQAPIKDWTQYLTSQIPGISDLSRASNVDLGGSSPVASTEGFGNMEAIINYLTAAGLKQTNEKDAVSGQFALKDYLKRQNG